MPEDETNPSSDSTNGIFASFAKIAPIQAQLVAGGGLLLAVAVLFFGRDGSPATVLAIAFFVLVLSVLVAAFAGAASKGDMLSKVSAWAISLIGISYIAASALALATGWPRPLANLYAEVLDSNAIIRPDRTPDVIEINLGMTADQISEALSLAFKLPSSDSKSERVRSIKNAPAIRLSDVEVDLSGDVRQLTVSTLELSNSTIVIGENNQVILADEIQSNGGRIVAFTSTAATGQSGASGSNAGNLTLEVLSGFNGALEVNLSGRDGNKGLTGQTGAPGTNGAQGSNAASGAFDCRRGAGRGGNGGPGGDGGKGGPGGNGGNGGTLTLIGISLDLVEFERSGGAPGAGGDGGEGGPGGSGGKGGSPRGLCSGSGPRGADGPKGAAGPDGPSGQPGLEGSLVSNGA